MRAVKNATSSGAVLILIRLSRRTRYGPLPIRLQYAAGSKKHRQAKAGRWFEISKCRHRGIFARNGGLNPAFHRRAVWATTVALLCGAIGIAALLIAVVTGHKLDREPYQTATDLRFAELWYDFAALEGAGTLGATAEAGFVNVPETANTGVAVPLPGSQPSRHCAQGTWPYFENDCLWGDADRPPEKRRKRIATRLKSPWCCGLHLENGAYFCRPQS